MLNAELADTTIPVTDAAFAKSGDVSYFWTERVVTGDTDISLTWYDIGDPLLIHTRCSICNAHADGVFILL